MTNKEHLKHRFLLTTINWLVKKLYGGILKEDKDICQLIDVTNKLNKPISDKYWDTHRFIAVPGLQEENTTYFIFIK